VKKSIIICVAFSMLLVCAGSSSAAPIFFDDFNTETYGTPATPSNWTVVGGSVDIIGSGPAHTQWDLIPGNGYYIDLDGSTGAPGLLATNVAIILAPGEYELSYDLAGNHRIAGTDLVAVDVGGGGWLETIGDYMQPLTTYSHTFALGAPTLMLITFGDVSGSPGDNTGPLLDNVRLDVIPAPGAILLGSIGAGLVGWLRRRRTL
jgi:hypothetical protein